MLVNAEIHDCSKCRVSASGKISSKWYVNIIYRPPQGSGTIVVDGTNDYKRQKLRRTREIVSPRSERNAALTNSQQLWFCAQVLFNIKPIPIPAEELPIADGFYCGKNKSELY